MTLASRGPGGHPFPGPADSRRHLRTTTSCAIEFAIGDGAPRTGICRDMSLGGLKIETQEPAPFGAELRIFIELKGIPGTTELTGFVRWTKPGIIGVQLGSFGARVTHAIIAMLADANRR
jgi:hypothetical protein